MEKRRAIIPLIVWAILVIVAVVAAIIAPVVYSTIIVKPQLGPGGKPVGPAVMPVSPGTVNVINTGVPTNTITTEPEEVEFVPVATISSVNFCDAPDEMSGQCTSNSQSFDSSVRRVYATVSITGGKIGSGFDIAWYKVEDGNPSLKLLDSYMINAADETLTTSLSSSNDEFPLGSGTYALKLIQEGNELGNYQFTVA